LLPREDDSARAKFNTDSALPRVEEHTAYALVREDFEACFAIVEERMDQVVCWVGASAVLGINPRCHGLDAVSRVSLKVSCYDVFSEQ
jgi:hypothetical protein